MSFEVPVVGQLSCFEVMLVIAGPTIGLCLAGLYSVITSVTAHWQGHACSACGYDLRGHRVRAPRCPECGLRFAAGVDCHIERRPLRFAAGIALWMAAAAWFLVAGFLAFR